MISVPKREEQKRHEPGKTKPKVMSVNSNGITVCANFTVAAKQKSYQFIPVSRSVAVYYFI